MRRAKGFGRLHTFLPALGVLFILALTPPLATAAVDPGYLKSFGPNGTSASFFEAVEAIAVDEGTGVVYVGDTKKQTLYKFDAEGHPLDWGGSAEYISGNEITGLDWLPNQEHYQAAVDPQTHVLYVTSGDNVRAFEPNGEPHEFIAGPGKGTSEISGAALLTGLAVDVKGNIYAADFADIKIRIYSRSGALLTEFVPKEVNTTLRPTSLAVAPEGSLYAALQLSRPFRFEPSQFPVTASTTYGLGESLEEVLSWSVGVDPTTSRVYVGQSIENTTRVRVFDEHNTPIGVLGGQGEEGDLAGVPGGIAVNGESERVYVADRSTSGQVKVFESFTFAAVQPTVTATSVIDLDLHTATLRAQINPNTLETTYHFEYGPEDCSTSVCTSVPLSDVSIGDGHRDVGVSQGITSLQPGTTYHYRVVAENAEGRTDGPDKTFTTPRSGVGFSLADERAWEMVSPPNKFGGRIIHFNQGVMQAAADGNGVAYQTVTSIEPNPDGNRAIDTSTVLARRDGAGGWSSKDITSPRAGVAQLRFGGEYKIFSTNLERALLEQQDNTPLSPEASEETPYLRDSTEPATYTPLVTSKEGFANVPPGTVFGGGGGSGRSPVAIVAADPSLTHPVLKSRTPLVSGAAPESLYQWSEGQLQPVSELPASEGAAVVEGTAGAGTGSIRHAVSADGSRVFWGPGRYSRPFGSKMSGLYVRDTVSGKTWRLDLAQPGASGEGVANPAFEGASTDGTVVFFSDLQQLTTDASAPDSDRRTRDLYRCEVGPLEGGGLGCTSLIDLSAPLAGSGEKAELVGITPGFGEDGSRIYFVARGVLDTAPNEAGETAVAGEPNLYLWEEGQGRRFIATLSKRDRADWGNPDTDLWGDAQKLSAAAAPNGRYLAFMSERSLTGYDNRDSKSQEPVEEVFRYDAIADRLDCISCNPSGASPEGQVSDPTGGDPTRADTQSNWSKRWVGAILPAAQESEPTLGLTFHHPRVIHDNGRVFFNAIDPLVSADSNGEWDVYQYEPTGTGDCTLSSSGAATARSTGGCVSLISSGAAEEEATFVDASEGGDSVFFITPERLSVLDEDSELDVYDARVDGVTAQRPVINECLGEACQSAPNPPNDPTPASAAFRGAGNVPSERCPASKRKVIRAGTARCVAKKHKRKKRPHKAKRAADKKRRAGR